MIDHGSSYQVTGGEVTEHYAGSVTVNTATFEQRAQADVSFALTWPEASVRVESSLDVVADAAEYHVTIAVLAEESGEQVSHRTWTRTYPRALA